MTATDDLLDDEAWDAIVCPTLEDPGLCGYSEPLEVSPDDGRRLRADHRARVAQAQADAERIAALEAERDRLRGFAADVLADWPESGPDCGDLQGIAEKHGVLVATHPSEPCDPDSCVCLEYGMTAEDFAAGKVKCYRRYWSLP